MSLKFTLVFGLFLVGTLSRVDATDKSDLLVEIDEYLSKLTDSHDLRENVEKVQEKRNEWPENMNSFLGLFVALNQVDDKKPVDFAKHLIAMSQEVSIDWLNPSSKFDTSRLVSLVQEKVDEASMHKLAAPIKQTCARGEMDEVPEPIKPISSLFGCPVGKLMMSSNKKITDFQCKLEYLQLEEMGVGKIPNCMSYKYKRPFIVHEKKSLSRNFIRNFERGIDAANIRALLRAFGQIDEFIQEAFGGDDICRENFGAYIANLMIEQYSNEMDQRCKDIIDA